MSGKIARFAITAAFFVLAIKAPAAVPVPLAGAPLVRLNAPSYFFGVQSEAEPLWVLDRKSKAAIARERAVEARLVREQKVQEEAAKQLIAQQEQAKAKADADAKATEAKRVADEQAAKAKADADAKAAEAKRVADEEASKAKADADGKAKAEADAKAAEAKRLADEQSAKAKADADAKAKAEADAKAAEAKRLADEQAAKAKADADAKAKAEVDAKAAEAKRVADEQAAKAKADADAKRLADEQNAKAKADAEAKATADAAEAQRRADEEAQRIAAQQSAKTPAQGNAETSAASGKTIVADAAPKVTSVSNEVSKEVEENTRNDIRLADQALRRAQDSEPPPPPDGALPTAASGLDAQGGDLVVAALPATGAETAQGSAAALSAVKQELVRLGCYFGPVDGQMTADADVAIATAERYLKADARSLRPATDEVAGFLKAKAAPLCTGALACAQGQTKLKTTCVSATVAKAPQATPAKPKAVPRPPAISAQPAPAAPAPAPAPAPAKPSLNLTF